MPSWVLGAYAVVSGAVFAYKWLTDRNRDLRNEIRKWPVTAIDQLQAGTAARVSGTLRYAGEPLIAPISKRPCAAWHVVIWQLKGERNKSWELVDDTQKSQTFYLDHGSSSVRVEGVWLDLLLHADRKAENLPTSALAPAFEEYLGERELLVHSFSWGRNAYRVHEGILEEAERVTVVGTCKRMPIPGRPGDGYRDAATELVIGPLDDDRLLASDEARLVV